MVWAEKRQKLGVSMKLTRKYLFDAVWEFPRKTLAERWDISANTITTGCKISQIPLPPPGYWTQREMGKPPQRPQLAGPEDELIELTDPPKRKPVLGVCAAETF